MSKKKVKVGSYKRADGTPVKSHSREIEAVGKTEVLSEEWEDQMKNLQESKSSESQGLSKFEKELKKMLKEKALDEKKLLKIINDDIDDSKATLGELSDKVDNLSVDNSKNKKVAQDSKKDLKQLGSSIKKQKKRAKTAIKKQAKAHSKQVSKL